MKNIGIIEKVSLESAVLHQSCCETRVVGIILFSWKCSYEFPKRIINELPISSLAHVVTPMFWRMIIIVDSRYGDSRQK